jgi:apolipoprotein D and lipocalin family protein
MNITYKLIVSLILLLSICCIVYAKNKMDRPVVKEVDLNRYTGVWYEVARLDHKFERNLVGVTATYTFLKNGKFRVLNQGYAYNLNGKHKKAKGVAKVPDLNVRGHLKVSFFWPFYADYYIMDLDAQTYDWALIGSKSMKYLWILSRKPKLDPLVLKNLITEAKKMGYETDKLIMVQQAE